MAIRHDFTISADDVAEVTVVKTHDVEHDADVVTLTQLGNEVVLTEEMANDLVKVIGLLRA